MSRDIRKYSRQTTVRLIFGGIAILLLVGIGLIYAFYGQGAAITGLLCMVLGMMPLIIIWIMFSILGWITRRVDNG